MGNQNGVSHMIDVNQSPANFLQPATSCVFILCRRSADRHHSRRRPNDLGLGRIMAIRSNDIIPIVLNNTSWGQIVRKQQILVSNV